MGLPAPCLQEAATDPSAGLNAPRKSRSKAQASWTSLYICCHHKGRYAMLSPDPRPLQRRTQMSVMDIAKKYFDAWNSRDPEAIVAILTQGGT